MEYQLNDLVKITQFPTTVFKVVDSGPKHITLESQDAYRCRLRMYDIDAPMVSKCTMTSDASHSSPVTEEQGAAK